MKISISAELGDYLINIRTKRIKQAMFVSQRDGSATVEEFFPPDADGPTYIVWQSYEYLVIPNINNIDPGLWED